MEGSSWPARSRKPKLVRMLLENCVQLRVSTHLETAGPLLALPQPLDDHRGRGIAEDEMRLPVAEIEMPGDDLRRHHQHAPLCAGPHQIDRDMQRPRRPTNSRAPCRRRRPLCRARSGSRWRSPDRAAGDARPRRSPCRCRRLPGPACSSARLADAMPNSAIERQLVVVARRDARRHALGIENAVAARAHAVSSRRRHRR